MFKLKRVALGPGTSVKLESRVSFAPLTTRRHYPGRHRAEVLVNGVAHPLGEFGVGQSALRSGGDGRNRRFQTALSPDAGL